VIWKNLSSLEIGHGAIRQGLRWILSIAAIMTMTSKQVFFGHYVKNFAVSRAFDDEPKTPRNGTQVEYHGA
jgi:hypothetical protein